MFKEFKEFAMRGNVLDLAVGVIIGAAFGGVVTSLVNDIIMPPIGMAMGGIDFKDYFIALRATDLTSLDAVKKAGVPVIAYGQFLNTVFNFLIVAFAIFLLVKQVNRFQRPAASQRPRTAHFASARFLSKRAGARTAPRFWTRWYKRLMKLHRIAVLMSASPARSRFDAQSELLANLDGHAEKKIVSLAEAVPAEKYSWRPTEGVRSVGEVYMHIAGANYMIPAALGAKAAGRNRPGTWRRP